jgi:hypothetical protein
MDTSCLSSSVSGHAGAQRDGGPVDLPGLRPLSEERARTEEASVMRTMPTPPTVIVHVEPEGARNRLWAVIGLLALGLAAAAVFLAIR